MRASLTVIDGGKQRTFTEHPIEIARRALLDAAELEDEAWAAALRRVASTLPSRAPAPSRPCDTRSPEQQEAFEREQQEQQEWDEAHHAWGRIPAADRESLLLGVLGDERLIIRELAVRLNAELGYPPQTRPRAVYTNHVRNLVNRMLRAGQLEREAETFNKTHMRYRYSRKRTLDGPIVELEQAYQEGGK